MENGNVASAERRTAKSRLVQHYMNECEYNPDWEKVRAVCTDRGWVSRRLRETYYSMRGVYFNKSVMNEVDVKFDESWNETFENYWRKENRHT